MKILQINSHTVGSTGNIMLGIGEKAGERGHECVTACPDSRTNRQRRAGDHQVIGTRLGRNLHLLLGEWTGLMGCFSAFATWRFLRWVDKFDPQVVHLHNLHSGYINLPMLFGYLRRKQIPVVWTLHDCWAFTGKCPSFDSVGCDRWESGCGQCPRLDSYPRSRVDTSRWMWRRKKQWFTSLPNLTLVTPSHWLGSRVTRSFLGDKPLRVIPNGVDLTVFRPVAGDVRRELGAEEKFLVLGVAFLWNDLKGLDVFGRLAEELGDGYRVVLVGDGDPRKVPPGVTMLPRTLDPQRLAAIYSAADVFVNPTREEVLGMVNLEALACGTPVVTFRTGGSPECVDETCGCVVDREDAVSLEREVRRVCLEKPYGSQACRKAAERFCRDARFAQYVELYEELYEKA